MIEYTARKISMKLNSIVPESNVNIMSYEIARKLNFYSIIILTAGIGAITNHFLESCLGMIGFAALRKFSGGRHLPLTPCTIVSVSLFTIAPILSISDTNMVLLTWLTVSLLLLYSKKEMPIKLASLALVMANLFVQSPVLTIVFIVQTALIIERKEGPKYD